MGRLKYEEDMLTDIHTHNLPNALHGEAIYSCPMPADGAWPPDAPLWSAAVHPWHLTAENAERQMLWVRQMAAAGHLAAIGEVGLDKRRGAPFDVQMDVLGQMAALGNETGLPLIIHNVKATDELIRLHHEMHPRNVWILHGFRGKAMLADECLRHGICLSFGEKFQAEALLHTPSDKLFVETDESTLDIADICTRIAAAKGIAADELRRDVMANAKRVFGT